MLKHIRVSTCLSLILLVSLVMQVGNASKVSISTFGVATEAIATSGQGRSFSVITAEVRHLTQRSAQIAKEIVHHMAQRNVAAMQQAKVAPQTLEEQSANLSRLFFMPRLTGHDKARDSSTFTPRQVAQAANHNVSALLQHKNSQLAGNWETF